MPTTIKKIIFATLVFLTAFICTTKAQDTVTFGYENYLMPQFQDSELPSFSTTGLGFVSVDTMTGIFVSQETRQPIYGAAFVLWDTFFYKMPSSIFWLTPPTDEYIDTNRNAYINFQMVVYDSANKNEFTFTDSAAFGSLNIHPYRYFHLYGRGYGDLALYYTLDSILPIKEVYFDDAYMPNASTIYLGVKNTEHNHDSMISKLRILVLNDYPFQEFYNYELRQDHFGILRASPNFIDFSCICWRDKAMFLFPILTPPPCYVPEVVGVDVVSNTSSRLTWKTTPYGTDFEVEYGPQGFVQGTGTVVSGIGDTSVILSGLEASVSYEAYLRAHCTRCEDQWSDYALIRFNTAGECGIAPTDMEKFVLLPNATHQQTTLHAPTLEEYHLEILNAAGQVILSQTLRGDLTLDVSSWPRGLYLFQIHGSRPNASTTKKLIVE